MPKDSPLSVEEEAKAKAEKARDNTLLELVETEDKYITQLKHILSVKSALIGIDKKQGIIKDKNQKQTMTNIFETLESILKVQQELIKEFKNLQVLMNAEPVNQEAVDAACVTIQHLHKLSALNHSQYISSYNQLQKILTHPELDKGMQKINKELKDRTGLELLDKVIMPVQRLPRYELFYRELNKHVNPEDPLSNGIKNLIKSISENLVMINERQGRVVLKSDLADLMQKGKLDEKTVKKYGDKVEQAQKDLIVKS